MLPPIPSAIAASWVHAAWSERSDFILQVTGQTDTHRPPSQAASLERDSFTLRSARYNIPSAIGRGHWELLQLAPDLLVVLTRATYAERLYVTAPGEDYLEFHYQLTGSMSWNDGTAGQLDLDEPSLLIVRQQPGQGIAEMIEGGLLGGSVTIYCRPSSLRRILGDYAGLLPAATAAVLGDGFAGLFAMRVVLYPALSKVVVDLARLETSGPLRLAYAEALVQQILCETFAALADRSSSAERFERLSDRDVRSLKAARDLIARHYTPPPRIDDVARDVGLNSKRLKSGFKMLFGKTMYEFAHDLRMNRGLELLRQREMSVGAVAEALGYSFQNSFTIAFRRRFGILPKDYRRNPLVL